MLIFPFDPYGLAHGLEYIPEPAGWIFSGSFPQILSSLCTDLKEILPKPWASHDALVQSAGGICYIACDPRPDIENAHSWANMQLNAITEDHYSRGNAPPSGHVKLWCKNIDIGNWPWHWILLDNYPPLFPKDKMGAYGMVSVRSSGS